MLVFARRGRSRPAVALALLTLASGASAHHSIAGIYDSRNPISFEAVVVEFQFVNPHPFVVVARGDSDTASQQWRLEMDNRFELAGIGMTAETLRKGDRIRVTGSAARDKSRALYIRRLERPSDGFWYEQVGSSPRVGSRK
jgi:hypothetical protein